MGWGWVGVGGVGWGSTQFVFQWWVVGWGVVGMVGWDWGRGVGWGLGWGASERLRASDGCELSRRTALGTKVALLL